MVRNMTAHLEVGLHPRRVGTTIVQGFAVWREIKKRGSGTLLLNLDERSISFKGSQ